LAKKFGSAEHEAVYQNCWLAHHGQHGRDDSAGHDRPGFGQLAAADVATTTVNDGGFTDSMVAGLLWPIGMPLVIRALDRWKHRWQTDLYSAAVVMALYFWVVLVSLFTLLQFA
jgi:hypothetical protein